MIDLKPGDLIAVPNDERPWAGIPVVSHRLYRVTRRTAAQAEAESIDTHRTIRVRVKDGKVIGKDYTRAVVATPQIVEEHNDQVRTLKRWLDATKRLEDLDGKNIRRLGLSIEQMDALADAWDQIKGMA